MARQIVVLALIFVAVVAGSVSAQEPSASPKAAPSPKTSSSPAATPVAASPPKTATAPVASAPKASSPVAAAPKASAASPTIATPAASPDVDISSPPAPGSEETEGLGPVEGPIAADQPTSAEQAPPAPAPKSAASGLEFSAAAVGVAAVSGFFLF